MVLVGYALWGIFPIYFYWLRDVIASEILAHRVIWSLVLLLGTTESARRCRLLR
jgi:chloramphenicol-sensitive protein RarD